MKNKILIILILFLMPINIKAIDTYSENAILYNLNDDKIIYEKNAYEKVKIASLTKIMTTIVAIENIGDIKEQIIMPQEAFTDLDGYVLSGLKPNDKITYEDLLYGIMLPSAADCANAIAIKLSGNIDKFVEQMNQKAENLGMKNTHFSNPVGIDDDNYSTVYDISLLLKYALKNKIFYEIFTTREYKTTTNLTLKSTIIEKLQPYNIDVSNILGSKTGFTDEAGNCLASIAKINNVKYLFITTKANINNSYHILDAVKIYDYFSKNYSYKKIINYNQYIKTIKIDDYINKQYEIKSDNDVYMYLNNEINIDDLEYEYDGIEEITKKTNLKEKIGKINIKYQDDILYEQEIYLDKNITFYNIKQYIISLITIVIISLILLLRIIKRNHLHKNK